MAQLMLLVNVIAMMMMIGVAFSEETNREPVQIKKPIRVGNVFPSNQNAKMFIDSSPILFFNLFKYKLRYQKLDKITTTTTTTTTTPPPRSCVCIPFYLCDSNQTIITDGTGIIDFR